jgi:hypothetical protein
MVRILDRTEKGLSHGQPQKTDPPRGGRALNKTSVGRNIMLNPVDDLAEDNLPALVVFNLDEAMHTDVLLGEEGRILTLSIEVHAGGKADVSDLMDDLSWECERLVMNSGNLGITANHLQIQEKKFNQWGLQRDAEGYLIHGMGATTLDIKYSWRAPDSEYDLEDFTRIHGQAQPDTGNEPVEQFRAELPQD